MRRMGRPGLVGTMARTAVVVGTASAVSGGMRNRQEQKQEQKQAAAQQQAAAAAPPPAPAPDEDDPTAKIKQLGELHAQGLLTDEEFSAAKAKALGL
jgi:membrane protease subunit (stomatin/prohibitin family)